MGRNNVTGRINQYDLKIMCISAIFYNLQCNILPSYIVKIQERNDYTFC